MAKEKGPFRATPPPPFAETSYRSYPSGDYSYTVELMATIQHTLGRLTEAIESLKAQSKEHGNELKTIGKDVYAAKAVGRTLLWVVGVVGTFLCIILAAYFRQLFSGSVR